MKSNPNIKESIFNVIYSGINGFDSVQNVTKSAIETYIEQIQSRESNE
jgi:hypothetical protein